MAEAKTQEIIARLKTVEQMATEQSVKQVCQIMQDYIITSKQIIGFDSKDSK